MFFKSVIATPSLYAAQNRFCYTNLDNINKEHPSYIESNQHVVYGLNFEPLKLPDHEELFPKGSQWFINTEVVGRRFSRSIFSININLNVFTKKQNHKNPKSFFSCGEEKLGVA